MNSGKIRIEERSIYWDFKNEILSEVLIDEIVIIGEYTINSMNDDWFLVFIDKSGNWKSISLYAENIEEILSFLSNKFYSDLKQTTLANSPVWKSVVRYPFSIKGKELFNLINNKIELNSEIKEFLS